MIGAPALAANAALRGGAGLVTVAVPSVIQLTVAGLVPCATTIALPQTPDERLDDDGAALAAAIGRSDVVALGPGLGAGDAALDRRWGALVRACSARPTVIDADGLNLVSRLGPASFDLPSGRWVITPHPGEMAALLGTTVGQVQADRVASAVEARRRLAGVGECIVVLKGAGTVVTDGERLYANRTGNPGMATGGSGDVLTGLIAALIGQQLSPFEAAVLGVHVHGAAGDRAARELGAVSLIATDVLAHLPAAIRAAASRTRARRKR